MPPEIFEVANLKTLILSNNPISSIPKDIAKLKNLTNLQMNQCSLYDDGIPEEISALNLEELSLSGNALTSIKPLTCILSLKRLNASQNEILEIPLEVTPSIILDQQVEET